MLGKVFFKAFLGGGKVVSVAVAYGPESGVGNPQLVWHAIRLDRQRLLHRFGGLLQLPLKLCDLLDQPGVFGFELAQALRCVGVGGEAFRILIFREEESRPESFAPTQNPVN